MAEIDNIEVTADNIFIEPELHNAQHQRASGLFVAQRTDKGKPIHQIPKAGRVAAVGPEVPSEIRVGARVLIKVDKPVGIRLGAGEGYLIVKPDQVIAEILDDGHIS